MVIGDDLQRRPCKLGLDGIVSKKLDAPYRYAPVESTDQSQKSAGTSGNACSRRDVLMLGSNGPRPPYCPSDPDQQTCSDESGNQVTDPSAQVDPKEAKNGARNCRPDDSQHDIHQESHITLHELFCQPACNSADDNGRDPAYLRIIHGSPSSNGTALI